MVRARGKLWVRGVKKSKSPISACTSRQKWLESRADIEVFYVHAAKTITQPRKLHAIPQKLSRKTIFMLYTLIHIWEDIPKYGK
jgi:hypothetical protein